MKKLFSFFIIIFFCFSFTTNANSQSLFDSFTKDLAKNDPGCKKYRAKIKNNPPDYSFCNKNPCECKRRQNGIKNSKKIYPETLKCSDVLFLERSFSCNINSDKETIISSKKNSTASNNIKKLDKSNNTKKEEKNSTKKNNTTAKKIPKDNDPWNIKKIKFDSYYSSYDICTEATNSFIEMVQCGKFYRTQNCIDNPDCGNEGNMFVLYADALSSGIKKGDMTETEAMLRFIEFRASLENNSSGTNNSNGLGITKFNNFLQFQNTVRGITGSSGW
jgi:hypothetical protein